MLLPSRSMYYMTLRQKSYFDTVIVGGGMVGNAMGCVLGLSSKFSSKKILLLESGKSVTLPTTLPSHYSNRVSAVSPISVDLFRKIGIWDQLLSYRAKKVNGLHVLDSCSRAEIQFFQPNSSEDIAYIVENDAIVGALFDRLRLSCPTVEIRTGVTVKKCKLPTSLNELASVELGNGDIIETALVIGADGVRSQVRDAMNIDYTGWNYEQSGVVATIVVETPSNNIAWQRFSPLGPIALLPLSQNLCSLVWSTSSDHAKELLALSPEHFIDKLNHALFTDENQNHLVNQSLFFLSRLGVSFESIVPPHIISLDQDTRASFPLGFGHAHSYVATRCALVGDSAHRVHPLAGQGVNLGWNDVILLTQLLERANRDGADIGSLTYLKDYDSVAQRHNVPILVSIDWLNRLYRTDSTPIVLLRSIGLSIVNATKPLKNILISRLSSPPTTPYH